MTAGLVVLRKAFAVAVCGGNHFSNPHWVQRASSLAGRLLPSMTVSGSFGKEVGVGPAEQARRRSGARCGERASRRLSPLGVKGSARELVGRKSSASVSGRSVDCAAGDKGRGKMSG